MKKTIRGFTLVELAIVMTIIGLLIGGILKGQELLQQARLTSTIAQIKSFEAATTAFVDMYGGLPGDLRDAGEKLPDCVNCSPLETFAGNGIVGDIDNCKMYREIAFPPTSSQNEVSLFWLHLLKANLISGVSDTSDQTAAAAEFGVTYPAAKIGGGFLATSAGYGGYAQVSGLNQVTSEPNIPGLYIAIHGSLELCTDEDSDGSVLTPGQAAQIDRKMDDGKPQTGSVFGNGFVSPHPASCFIEDGNGGYIYDEAQAVKNCEIFARIQN